MALPTLPSNWTRKHEHIERQMSKIHEQHQRYCDQWDSHANYYKKQHLNTNVGNSLTSEQSFKKSMSAYSCRDEKSRKAAALHRRREKLRLLLQAERDSHEAELRKLSLGNYSRLHELKEKTEGLKSAREEKRKQLAEEKLYEHWKANNPELRLVESKLHQDHVKEVWEEQTDRKKMDSARQEREEKVYLNEYEEQRLRAEENLKKKENERMQRERERAEVLRQQMKDLKHREEAAKILKREEEEILQEQWKLEHLKEERRRKEEERKKAKLQRFLHHQYKAQMRRRAQQVQEELELDREILDQLQRAEVEDKQMQTERREQAKEDVEWMKKVLEEQLALERQRETELDLIYREEARREWEKREREWEKERGARERLMHEVLGERMQQITSRKSENRKRQEDLMREREDLIEMMEGEQKTSRLDRENEERKKQERHEELRGQISEREQHKHSELDNEERELIRERQQERDYQEIMREETNRMQEMGFVAKRRPRSSRRAWD